MLPDSPVTKNRKITVHECNFYSQYFAHLILFQDTSWKDKNLLCIILTWTAMEEDKYEDWQLILCTKVWIIMSNSTKERGTCLGKSRVQRNKYLIDWSLRNASCRESERAMMIFPRMHRLWRPFVSECYSILECLPLCTDLICCLLRI